MGNNYFLISPAKRLTAIAVLLAVSCSGCWWSGSLAETAEGATQRSTQQLTPASNSTLADVPSPVLEESPGVITVSKYYPLLARTKGRIKRIFFQPGQYVHKGDVLVKGYDHNFVVAPANALIAERLIDGSTYLLPSTAVASLVELQPFQIQIMPPSPYAQPIVPGWEASINRWEDKSFAASGVVVGSHISSDGALFVDLRLRRLDGGPLPVGTKIKAVLTPPQL